MYYRLFVSFHFQRPSWHCRHSSRRLYPHLYSVSVRGTTGTNCSCYRRLTTSVSGPTPSDYLPTLHFRRLYFSQVIDILCHVSLLSILLSLYRNLRPLFIRPPSLSNLHFLLPIPLISWTLSSFRALRHNNLPCTPGRRYHYPWSSTLLKTDY